MGLPGRIRIGCSGWEYKHWRGEFYPPDIPRARWFEHYASSFDTVEINNTFYRLPEAATFARWADRAPRGFVYAVKASRYLTHMKKLKDPDAALQLMFDRMRSLGGHLGPVLYQLPPRWKVDLPRLERFLTALPKRVKHAIEFRDPSWYTDAVFRLLERRAVSLCLHDMRDSATARVRIGRFVYVRFHGTSGRYNGAYSDRQLADWAEWLDAQRRDGATTYAYFNNDVGGHAPRNALTLRRLLNQPLPDRLS